MTAVAGAEAAWSQPDPGSRAHKGVWRQYRAALGERLVHGLRPWSVDERHVEVRGVDDFMAGVLSADCARHLDGRTTVWTERRPPEARTHAGVVVVGECVGAPQRIDVIREVHARLRSSGTLVVLTTVVGAPRQGDGCMPPSASALLEQLNVATGGALAVDDISSMRWGSEPLVRGMCVTGTSLSVGDGGWG